MEELESLSKAELIARVKEQEQYIKQLESKRPRLDTDDDIEAVVAERLKQHQRDAARRENTLVHRLTAKEQELQDYMNQITEIKQAQTQGTAQLRTTLLDPAINIVFQRMAKEMDDAQEKLKQTQNELSAWKFTPDSQTGKKLMARCQMLLQENEELGKTIASGRTAKLEGEIALQKTLVTEMKNNQSELDEFLGDLEDDVEGMQSMILVLQQQLRESKDQIAALQEENSQLREGGTYSPKHRDKLETKVKTEEIGPFKCKVKKEETKHTKPSRSHSSDFSPMETGYDNKDDGDGEYGQGDVNYSRYDDDSYYEDYADNYSPYGSNKDGKYSYHDSEYENGYGERTERRERKHDSQGTKYKKDSKEIKHESMEVDEEISKSEHFKSANKSVGEKTNTAHSEVSKSSKHLAEDAEMTAVSKVKDEMRNKGHHEEISRQHRSSSEHRNRETDMEMGNEEVSSTVVSSTHASSHRDNRDLHSKDNNKGNISPHNKLTKEQLSEENPQIDDHLETSSKSENKPLTESSISDKVSPSRTKSSIQLLIEPRPPKDNSPLKDLSSDRTSPKPHSSPSRTKSPKGNLSPRPHKDRSSPDAGNIDRSPVRDSSPHTNSASKDNSPNKDRSPGSATSPFKEREPVLQKFLNGVTSTVDDIEDL